MYYDFLTPNHDSFDLCQFSKNNPISCSCGCACVHIVSSVTSPVRRGKVKEPSQYFSFSYQFFLFFLIFPLFYPLFFHLFPDFSQFWHIFCWGAVCPTLTPRWLHHSIRGRIKKSLQPSFFSSHGCIYTKVAVSTSSVDICLSCHVT